MAGLLFWSRFVRIRVTVTAAESVMTVVYTDVGLVL